MVTTGRSPPNPTSIVNPSRDNSSVLAGNKQLHLPEETAGGTWKVLQRRNMQKRAEEAWYGWPSVLVCVLHHSHGPVATRSRSALPWKKMKIW